MFYLLRFLIMMITYISMVLQKIKLLLMLTRWKDWMLIPLILVMGYFITLHTASVYTDLIFMLVAFSLSLSFGFAINEYFDAPYDKMKPIVKNVISKNLISKSHAAVFCTFLLVACIVVGYCFLSFRTFVLLVAFCILCYAYSAPPFRMKERAYLGIINHGIFYPIIFLAGYTANLPFNAEAAIFSIVAFMLSLLTDITQEIRDMDVDKKSKFKTTALEMGYIRSLTSLKIITALSIIFFITGVLLFRPIYILLLSLGMVFYIKALVANPSRSELFAKSIDAWNRGIITSALIGLFILFYFYF